MWRRTRASERAERRPESRPPLGGTRSDEREGLEVERQEERPTPPESAGGATKPATIDVERLADRVYQLLRAEVRLGRARGEALPHRGRMDQ